MEDQFQKIMQDFSNLQDEIIKYKSEQEIQHKENSSNQNTADFLKEICAQREQIRNLLLETVKDNDSRTEILSDSLKDYGLPSDIQTVYSDYQTAFKNFCRKFSKEEIYSIHDTLQLMKSKEHEEFFNKSREILDDNVYQELEQSAFTFNDIPLLSDRAVQKILREIDQNTVALALIKAETVKQKIIANMSQNAGRMLQEDIEILSRTTSEKMILEARDAMMEIIYHLKNCCEINLPPFN